MGIHSLSVVQNRQKSSISHTIMGDGEWKMGLFGCFSNLKLSIITYFVPCITIGQTAENLGEDSMIMGAIKSIIPIYSCFWYRGIRNKAAEKSGIPEESCISYLIKMGCCGICAVVQTAHEVDCFAQGESMDIERV